MSRKRPPASVLVVVDRREGDVIVVVDENGGATDVPASELPRSSRAEGAVLRVPIDGSGVRRWNEAVRDRGEERRRRAGIAERIDRLRRTDPGGDIEL